MLFISLHILSGMSMIISLHTYIHTYILILLWHLPVSVLYIYFFMRDWQLPMKHISPSPWHWCCPRERQMPIQLGTSVVTGVARTKLTLDCLRDFRSGSEFRVLFFFNLLDQLPPSAIEHSLSCYLPIAFEKTQGY